MRYLVRGLITPRRSRVFARCFQLFHQSRLTPKIARVGNAEIKGEEEKTNSSRTKEQRNLSLCFSVRESPWTISES